MLDSHPPTEKTKAASGSETVKVTLPAELVRLMEEVIEYLGFGSKEEFIMASVRRLLDYYNHLISEIPK